MRALVVEDDLRLQQQIRGMLEKAGFVVDAAADGEEGVFLATGYPLNTILFYLR